MNLRALADQVRGEDIRLAELLLEEAAKRDTERAPAGEPAVTMTEAEAAAWHPWLTGWSDDILPWYRAIAPTLPHGARVVEVGVSHGRSAVFLAAELLRLGRTDVELYGVDFWPGEEVHKILATLAVCATGHGPGVRGHVDGLQGVPGLLRLLRCEGTLAARLFDDGSLDVVFIDSDHTAAPMLDHLARWSNKVRAGGIIAGHDYCAADWPGVVEAVDTFFATRGVTHPTRSVWAHRVTT